jgi:hypothetical protein
MTAPAAPSAERKAVSLVRLRAMLAAGEKIAMLTAYDAGVDCLLVGDSLGMEGAARLQHGAGDARRGGLPRVLREARPPPRLAAGRAALRHLRGER